jgi:5-formyltetrahydrofolate cyclo-ligase
MTAPSSFAATLRTNAKRARRTLDADVRCAASRRITEKFLNSRYFLSSQSIACYLATWDEVDTSAIIERAWRANKRIFAPVIDTQGEMTFNTLRPETTLVRNRFGLWEPESALQIEPSELDVVVTPLVAFDHDCNRIGMGGGYFDRAFAFLKSRQTWLRPKLVGLAFDCQKVEKIAPNPWDIRLYRVFSESG